MVRKMSGPVVFQKRRHPSVAAIRSAPLRLVIELALLQSVLSVPTGCLDRWEREASYLIEENRFVRRQLG